MTYKRPPGLDEFDVYKYTALENFEPGQWAPLIESRLLCQKLINLAINERGNDTNVLRPLTEVSGKAVKQLLDYPLTPIFAFGRSASFPKSKSSTIVRPLTASNILDLQRALLEVQDISPDKLSEPEIDPSLGNWEGRNYDKPIDEVIKNSKLYKVRHLANLTIDLRATDQDIRKDFNKLLSLYRKTSKIDPPSITEAKLKQWHINKMLPYADLKIWSQCSGTTLKDNDFIELLFEGDDDGKVKSDPLYGTIRDYKEAISYDTLAVISRGIAVLNNKIK